MKTHRRWLKAILEATAATTAPALPWQRGTVRRAQSAARKIEAAPLRGAVAR